MLPKYTWCILLYTKEADEVVYTYLVNIYSTFGGSHTVFSDNGSEFKNKLIMQVASIWIMKQVFGSPYYS